VKAMNDTETRRVDVSRLIESIVELFNTIQAFKHNVTVRMQLTDGAALLCNVNECSQIFENIIRNAWEAVLERKDMEENHFGELKILTAVNNGHVNIVFKDNGIGIKECSDCRQSNCLNCGKWRIGNTTKQGGTGLGMFFVAETIKRHGGDLKVISQYREGTEIHINLKK